MTARDVESIKEACVKALLAGGADPTLRDAIGDTPLHSAAWSGGLGIVQLLVAHKAVDVNAVNGERRTALMLAAQKGHTDIVCALLSAGADRTLADQYGNTALDCAVRYGHNSIARLLAQ